MLTLTVLGSSSKGNGYIVESESSALLIECGVPFIEVKKAMDFNISKIAGAILSHSHGDHAGFVKQYLQAGIKVYTSHETITESKFASFNWVGVTERFNVGDFDIIPVPLKHDVRCYGFLIRCKNEHTFCFITDTHYCPFTFSGLKNIIVECNYDEEILEARSTSGKLPPNVRNRVLNSHISLDTCRNFLEANDLSSVNNIVLIHLSDGNSDARKFKTEMEQRTGKAIHIARPGMKIDFSSKPF